MLQQQSLFMLTPDRSPSMDSPTENNIRKRVCKACDRCRLKKSKVGGSLLRSGLETNSKSVMDLRLAAVARLTTPFAFLESARSPTTRCILRGQLHCRTTFSITEYSH